MLKIGEFSRLSRVSVRMLRHYDQLGLLRPSHIDNYTGYRHYSADQLPRLNRILAMRDLGFSLEQIAVLIDENISAEQFLGMLTLKRAEVEQTVLTEQKRLARLAAHIDRITETDTVPTYDFILRKIEPELIAGLRMVAVDDDQITRMFEELETYVAGYDQARADRPPQTIYYDAEYKDEEIDAEVVVPLSRPIPDTGPIRVYELPGIEQAVCTVHHGGYTRLVEAYHALLGYIEANQFSIAGPLREVYLRYGAGALEQMLPGTYLSAGQEQYVTELVLPVIKR